MSSSSSSLGTRTSVSLPRDQHGERWVLRDQLVHMRDKLPNAPERDVEHTRRDIDAREAEDGIIAFLVVSILTITTTTSPSRQPTRRFLSPLLALLGR